MLNKKVLEEHLTKKFSNQLFHSVVFECFINALPLDKSEMSKDERTQLWKYTGNVLKSLGGIEALESSMDIQHKSLEQNLFLAGMYNICMESAKKCAKECSGSCKSDDALEDCVQKATLSKEECKKFAKNAKNMNFDDVAEVIKKKTLSVIQDEKDAYKKEQELDKELEDALDDSAELDDDDIDNSGLESDMKDPKKEKDDNAFREEVDAADESGGGITEGDTPPDKLSEYDKSKSQRLEKQMQNSSSVNGPSKSSRPMKASESFRNFHLDRLAPRNHISVFSRLQDTAMEMTQFIKVPNYGRDYFPILEATTFESLFEKPVDMIPAVESSSIVKEEVCDVPSETKPKVATLVSIITYTIMETLHSLGIFNPSQDMIRKFVNTTSNSLALQKKSVDESCNGIKCAVKESAMIDFSKLSSNKLGHHLTRLKTALEGAQAYIDEYGADTDMINVASEAVKYIHGIEEIMDQRVKDHKALSEATESALTQREKAHDLTEFNRITNYFKGNPQITEIRLLVDPDMPSMIDVHCANESGQVIRSSYMNLEYACESDNYLKYIDDMYKKSKMPSMNKDVLVKIQDGRGQMIKL